MQIITRQIALQGNGLFPVVSNLEGIIQSQQPPHQLLLIMHIKASSADAGVAILSVAQNSHVPLLRKYPMRSGAALRNTGQPLESLRLRYTRFDQHDHQDYPKSRHSR